MGLYDYEKMHSQEFPVKYNGAKVSQLEMMSLNKNWLNEVNPYVSSSDPIVKLLNRPVFKATQLREEIYFITCRCYNAESKFNDFTFIVNENTIFKRFRIYKDVSKSDEFFLRGEVNLNEFLTLFNDKNYRKVFRFFGDEQTKFNEALESIDISIEKTYKHYLDYGFTNGMIIEPLNIQHFNKRTWIYLLMTHNTLMNLNLNYKTVGNDAYYDNEFAKKYN